jgi:hypothetical protein
LTLDTTVTAPAPAGQDVTANLNGCADFSAGLGVNAGADAAFFNLFDTNKQVNIFQKNFDLFKVCFFNFSLGSLSLMMNTRNASGTQPPEEASHAVSHNPSGSLRSPSAST